MPAKLRGPRIACSAFCKLLLILATLYLASAAQACTPTATLHCVQAGNGAGNDVFVPANITINLGDSVAWSENATQTFDEHSSVSGTCTPNTFNCNSVPGWDTGIIPLSTDSPTITFNSAGLHNYFCRPHGGFMLGSVTVNKGTASVVLSSLPSSTIYGQNVTFTATVSSSIVAPTGSVNFVDSTFGTILATATISGGVATVQTATVPAGAYNVVASYSGDGNFNPSTSAGVKSLTVNPANTNTALVDNTASPSLAGQNVSFTATVTNTDTTATPSGNVTFTDSLGPGTTIPLDVNGVATWTTTTLPAGSNSITASFHDPSNPPTGNFSDSGPTAAITQTVQDYVLSISNPALTTTPNQPVTYNGTLTGLGGFNAFVSLSCAAGGTTPPSPCNPSPSPLKPTVSPGAPFTLTVQNAVVNDFSFNIVGGGVAGLPNRQQAVTFVVSNFALGNPNPPFVSSVQGNPSNPTNFTVSSQGSFTGAVNLACTGAGNTALPASVSCNFSQNPIALDPGKSVTVTVTLGTTLATPVGNPSSPNIEIHGNALASPAAPITLNVSAGTGSFDLSVAAFDHNKTSDPVMVGGTLEFDATVSVCPTSTCTGTATTTLVVDFDGPAKVISATFLSACGITGGVVTCTASLASGSSAIATIKVAAPFQRTLKATAQVSSTSADPLPVNNVRTDTALIRVRPLARKGLVPKQP